MSETLFSQLEVINQNPAEFLRRRKFRFVITASFLLSIAFFTSVAAVFFRGVGIWGNNIPVAWAFPITNFVWWIGIGHAGTFISAILLLFGARYRRAISRFAETMTVFAILNAAMFPILHLGRPWLFFWLLPYPNTMGLGPQFRSALMWDLFAVLTYFTVSILFWYLALIPDFATLRNTVPSQLARKAYGYLSLGWRGEREHWALYKHSSKLLAAIATPLVISVHSIVSLDFAEAIAPGWHNTLFPPYFVAGAIYSGLALVLTLLIPLRRLLSIERIITQAHIERLAKIMLGLSVFLAYSYAAEIYFVYYLNDRAETALMHDRLFGSSAIFYWTVILLNIGIPQCLWFKWCRKTSVGIFVVSLAVDGGMWLERFLIVIRSLTHSRLPSAWSGYSPTLWDFATLMGSVGLFFFLLFIAFRNLPLFSLWEVNEEAAEQT